MYANVVGAGCPVPKTPPAHDFIRRIRHVARPHQQRLAAPCGVHLHIEIGGEIREAEFREIHLAIQGDLPPVFVSRDIEQFFDRQRLGQCGGILNSVAGVVRTLLSPDGGGDARRRAANTPHRTCLEGVLGVGLQSGHHARRCRARCHTGWGPISKRHMHSRNRRAVCRNPPRHRCATPPLRTCCQIHGCRGCGQIVAHEVEGRHRVDNPMTERVIATGRTEVVCRGSENTVDCHSFAQGPGSLNDQGGNRRHMWRGHGSAIPGGIRIVRECGKNAVARSRNVH